LLPTLTPLFPYTTLFRSTGRRWHDGDDSQGGRAGRKDGVVHPVLHGRSLDDPALPLRPADEPGVESDDAAGPGVAGMRAVRQALDRKSTRLNSSHRTISY